MRTPIRRIATLIAVAGLAACSSGTTIIVRQPAPPPPPPPPRIEPLEITVARPVRGHLLVQTNRPSYVALFEIVPDRGVALLAPSYAHQRTWMLAGLNWVPVSWKVQSTLYYGPASGTTVPARWVYAIASDEPLRLPDEAFHPSYMRRVLGPAAFRGTNPYVTMRAISRAFLPSVIDESWAEDAYVLKATYASDPYRTVRIYCANRTVYEVPEEIADRAWCPVNTPSGGTVVRVVPTRPDSIVAGNGVRMRRRLPETTPVRVPVDRVAEPERPNTPVVIDNPPRNDPPKDVRDVKEKERRGNGNAYGHTDDPNVKGRGIENEKKVDPRQTPRVDTLSTTPAHQPDNVELKPERQDARQQKQEAKQDEKLIRHEEKQAEKAEKVEQKADERPAKTEEKPHPKAEEQPQPKVEEKPHTKADGPPQPKAEVKAETKEEKGEAKAEENPAEKQDDKATGKPDDKPTGKPEIRPPGKKNKP